MTSPQLKLLLSQFVILFFKPVWLQIVPFLWVAMRQPECFNFPLQRKKIKLESRRGGVIFLLAQWQHSNLKMVHDNFPPDSTPTGGRDKATCLKVIAPISTSKTFCADDFSTLHNFGQLRLSLIAFSLDFQEENQNVLNSHVREKKSRTDASGNDGVVYFSAYWVRIPMSGN